MSRTRWIVGAGVALATGVVFSGVLGCGFLNWDDYMNFLENPFYRGLHLRNLSWMFTTSHMGHYQPLSWLTLGLDYSLWGMEPRGYHLTNLLLHTANAVLFYSIALRLLGRCGHSSCGRDEDGIAFASGFAALLFSIHPLRVESVAWVTERRDVLSGFFYLSSVLAYLGSVREGPDERRWVARLRWSWLLFLCATMSKATTVVLPVVLLALDVFPLRRLPPTPDQWLKPPHRAVISEKIPFLCVSILIGIVGVFASHAEGGLVSVERFGLSARLSAGLFGLCFYPLKTLIPVGLIPLYPAYLHSELFSLVSAARAALIAGFCWAAWSLRQRWPAASATWGYYLVVIAPLSGILQNGPQAAADRYSYLSCLGWPLLAGIGMRAAWRRWGRASWFPALLLCAASGFLTWRQTRVWRDSVSLWTHAVAADDRVAIAHLNLGEALAAQGRLPEAVESYRKALAKGGQETEEVRAKASANIHMAMGKTYSSQGKVDESIQEYLLAVSAYPRNAPAVFNLGMAFVRKGDLPHALEMFQKAVAIEPGRASYHNAMGVVLGRLNRKAEAERSYRRALELDSEFAAARSNLARLLAGHEMQVETPLPSP